MVKFRLDFGKVGDKSVQAKHGWSPDSQARALSASIPVYTLAFLTSSRKELFSPTSSANTFPSCEAPPAIAIPKLRYLSPQGALSSCPSVAPAPPGPPGPATQPASGRRIRPAAPRSPRGGPGRAPRAPSPSAGAAGPRQRQGPRIWAGGCRRELGGGAASASAAFPIARSSPGGARHRKQETLRNLPYTLFLLQTHDLLLHVCYSRGEQRPY